MRGIVTVTLPCGEPWNGWYSSTRNQIAPRRAPARARRGTGHPGVLTGAIAAAWRWRRGGAVRPSDPCAGGSPRRAADSVVPSAASRSFAVRSNRFRHAALPPWLAGQPAFEQVRRRSRILVGAPSGPLGQTGREALVVQLHRDRQLLLQPGGERPRLDRLAPSPHPRATKAAPPLLARTPRSRTSVRRRASPRACRRRSNGSTGDASTPVGSTDRAHRTAPGRNRAQARA